jgi:hypothetical protein
MSNLRVALIAEGETDFLLVEAALKAILPAPFILTLIQPEATQPRLGTGWGGVLRWGRQSQERGFPSLEDDPTLSNFQIFVIHLDADVAEANYADLGLEMEERAARTSLGLIESTLPKWRTVGIASGIFAHELSASTKRCSRPQ